MVTVCTSDLLPTVLRLIEMARRSASTPFARTDRLDLVQAWTEELFTLGLAWSERPELLRSPTIDRVRTDLDPLIPRLEGDVAQLAYVLERKSVSGYGALERWQSVCYRRSEIAFFLELFGAHPDVAESTDLHQTLAELDERIPDKSSAEGPLRAEDIPTGIPVSHWWWWCPRLPPTAPGTVTSAGGAP